MKYGFVGVGKMGGAILKGLLDSGKIDKSDVMIAGRDFDKTRKQAEALGVEASETKQHLTECCDVIVIGVEPGSFPDVMPLISEKYTNDKLVISMAAGITISTIESYLGDDAKVIRIMPNAPARVGEIMVSVSPNRNVTQDEAEMAVELLSGMGKAVIVPEDLISAVIGVSGSSPAYTYMYIRALSQAAVKYGMDEKSALTFAAQAVLGAAKIVLTECTSDNYQNSDGPEQKESGGAARLDDLIDAVCTPGGTTIEAVKSLNENGFEDIVKNGAEAAIEKSLAMSRK